MTQPNPIRAPFELTFSYSDEIKIINHGNYMGFVVYILSDTTQQSRNRYELEGTWFPTMGWYDSVHTLFREYNFLDFPLNIIDTLCYLPGSSVMIQFRDSTMMEKKPFMLSSPARI